jgi:hypothetical protein
MPTKAPTRDELGFLTAFLAQPIPGYYRVLESALGQLVGSDGCPCHGRQTLPYCCGPALTSPALDRTVKPLLMPVTVFASPGTDSISSQVRGRCRVPYPVCSFACAHNAETRDPGPNKTTNFGSCHEDKMRKDNGWGG